MAIGSQIPPRAYTRDILTTAFNWLQTQPEAVRAKATTPDALVALYVQAQRGGQFGPNFGQGTLEADAPVSSQAFMSDLKNLAEGLKEFDDSQTARPAANAGQNRLSTLAAPVSASSAPAPSSGFGAISGPMTTTPQSSKSPPPPQPTPNPTPAAPVAAPIRTQQLNDRSLAMLREVQFAMNLSSETEAMNMMIAIAYKNLKSVIA